MLEIPTSGPLLVVCDPDGVERARLDLSGNRVTVGRLPDANDVSLQPDQDHLVTRKEHCIFQRVGSRWFVSDQGSANGTFIRRAGEMSRISSQTELDHGDAVCIVGRWERRTPRYWELRFVDQTRTRAVDARLGTQGLIYDESSRRLLILREGTWNEISVRPQAHKLVLHIAKRNADNGGKPVLCSHDELMQAVWGDEGFHTRNDLVRLFWELRQKLKPFGADDLVEAEARRGYRVAVSLA